MAQVLIYARRAQIDSHRSALSDAIHSSLMDAFGLPADKRFQRFIGLDDADFIHPADRGRGYTIVDIHCFAGRSPEAKKRLLHLLMERLPTATGLQAAAFEITIHESPRENWGIRGKTGDELVLNYKVDA